MKSRKQDLNEEVEQLAQECITSEASSEVWKRFESALSQLDAESLGLLTQHLKGSSIQSLSRQKNLSEAQIQAWVTKTKQELIELLRRNSQVKH
jgi:hypothetical protein